MTEAPDPSPSAGERTRALIRTVAPWLLAAGLIVWISGRVSWSAAWDAAQEAALVPFAIAMCVAGVYWFLLDSLGYSMLFTRFNAPVSWAEARSVRALTYLVTPINWNLGTAAVVLHLRQSKGIPAAQSTGSMMLYGMVDGLVIVSLLVVGLVFITGDHGMGDALPGAIIFFTAQFGFLALVVTDRPKWRWLERIRGSQLMQSYRRSNFRDLALLFGLRTAYFSGFVGLFAFGTSAFGVDLPLPFTAMSLPLVLGSAMFTPAGVGGQQAVMLALYAPYGSEPAILAFAVAYPVALTVVRMLIGLAYLGDLRAIRDARRAAAAEVAAESV